MKKLIISALFILALLGCGSTEEAMVSHLDCMDQVIENYQKALTECDRKYSGDEHEECERDAKKAYNRGAARCF